MAGTLTPTPFQTVLDTDGVAVSGALIYTYVGGTTTAAATYTTSALSVANANPIVADAAGRFVAYLPAGGNFKFLYKTAAGATIEEQDNILSVPGAAVNLDIEGTVGEAVTAGQVCYLSTGAEATPLTAGLWYLTDADAAATSTLPQSIGVAVSAIAINTAGTIRLAGTATMATAVVIGSTYYVSATAGAITATAPALSRTVGVALTTSTLLLAATTAVVTPGGSNTQVQFNDAGVLGGDAGFTYIKATDAVTIVGPLTVGGTLGVTGVATLTAAPVFSSATASQAMFTDGSKALVSNAITGTGNVVMSASPTLTGTIGAAAMTLTGALAANGGITVDSTAFIVADTTGNMTCGTATTGLINGQTISSAANLTGSLGVASILTVSGAGTSLFQASNAGGLVAIRINNTDTTSTSSHSRLTIDTGSGAGDPLIAFSSGAGDFALGIDNTDDTFQIVNGSSLGTTVRVKIDSNGAMTKPAQPAFLATAALQSNVTGDSTLYTVTFTNEIFDQANNFASSTFTAPVTGKYQLNVTIAAAGMTTSQAYVYFELVASNRLVLGPFQRDGEFIANDQWYGCMSVLMDMDAGDTAIVRILVNNATKVVDIQASLTTFSGYLVA